jgi:F0F1-type ATP synthase membrane subunit b/b'
MEMELNTIIEKIKQEGIGEAEKKAAGILDEARKKADELVKEGEKKKRSSRRPRRRPKE